MCLTLNCVPPRLVSAAKLTRQMPNSAPEVGESDRNFMTRRRVYLDKSATTPVDPRVAAAMARSVVENFGNASSVHGFGQQARAAVDRGDGKSQR